MTNVSVISAWMMFVRNQTQIAFRTYTVLWFNLNQNANEDKKLGQKSGFLLITDMSVLVQKDPIWLCYIVLNSPPLLSCFNYWTT